MKKAKWKRHKAQVRSTEIGNKKLGITKNPLELKGGSDFNNLYKMIIF